MDGFFEVNRRPTRAQGHYLDGRRCSVGSSATRSLRVAYCKAKPFRYTSWRTTAFLACRSSQERRSHIPTYDTLARQSSIIITVPKIGSNTIAGKFLPISSALPRWCSRTRWTNQFHHCWQCRVNRIHIAAFGKAVAAVAARASAASQFSSVHHTSSSCWLTHPGSILARGVLAPSSMKLRITSQHNGSVWGSMISLLQIFPIRTHLTQIY